MNFINYQNLFIFFLVTIITHLGHSQKQGNIWYFSQYAGIDFNSSPPVAITNGVLSTADNSSALCNLNGSLMLYSDGLTVYNKNHNIMANGTGLAGSTSGGQSSLIVPIPESNKVIVFSVPDVGNKPLYYSIVDMSLNGGLGVVTQKNIFLYSNTTEKIACFYQCNDQFYWVITHKYLTNEFYTYKIDQSGLNTTPIISKIGIVHNAGPIGNVNNSAGQLSISKDGSRIVSALYFTGQIELFDFDINTGRISNAKLISNVPRAWGVEFSEDATKLYLSQWTYQNITQYDLSVNNINFIVQSATNVGSLISQNGIYHAGYLQRGPDNKIYIARWDENQIGAIQNPNAKGLACNLISNAINISPGLCKAGLCRTIMIERQNRTFTLGSDTILCEGELLVLRAPNLYTKWSNGIISDQITVFQSGVFWARIETLCDTFVDTIRIDFIKAPILDLGPDRFICQGGFDTLWSNSSNTLWSDGSIGPFLIISKAGTFFGSIENDCKIVSDTINIVPFGKITLDLGPDIVLCYNQKDTIYSPHILNWNDGTINYFIEVNGNNTYWGTLTTPCSIISDTFRTITIPEILKPYLAHDTTYCFKDKLCLNIPLSPIIWNNKFLNNITVNFPGIYKYEFKNQCQTITDSIEVRWDSIPNKFTDHSLIVCDENSIILNSGIDQVLWSTGDQARSININQSGKYSYTVNNTCGIYNNEIDIEFRNSISIYLPNVFSPNGDNINDFFPPKPFPMAFYVEIFNRWGGLIFSGTNQYWDGTIKNYNVNAGVYIYILHTTDCKNVIKHGTITLVK
ncbi:MAG: gliding motility-associated C-terminal domain-containing protein [Saprospiraceae bacterium]|uniref:Gliding motility-associated C-terminal domain-containing protein n=1 Tax=Candidatus Defluviibacterium haderslevense TaxID=2981993 RepID=A0A9D7XGD1_9BACT|nr:gliding motility-associated C-terminal domain-containing protein [Candidatus Defluviibacterium haderslevense]